METTRHSPPISPANCKDPSPHFQPNPNYNNNNNMSTGNGHIAQRQISSRSQHYNSQPRNVGNGSGYRGRRSEDPNLQNGMNPTTYSVLNGSQWASTSSGIRPQQLHNNPRTSRPPYKHNGGGGGGIDGGHRRTGGADYWHKNNVGGGQSGSSGIRDEDRDRRIGGSANGYYQRNNWQARNHHPNAPPPISVAQRRARGPLPDWDEVISLCYSLCISAYLTFHF